MTNITFWEVSNYFNWCFLQTLRFFCGACPCLSLKLGISKAKQHEQRMMSPKWLLISQEDLDLDLNMCCTPKSHDWSEHFPTQNDVIVWYTAPFSDPIWSRNHFQFSHKITITPMTYLFQVYPFPHLTPSSPSRPHLKLRSRFVAARGAHKGLEKGAEFFDLWEEPQWWPK